MSVVSTPSSLPKCKERQRIQVLVVITMLKSVFGAEGTTSSHSYLEMRSESVIISINAVVI